MTTSTSPLQFSLRSILGAITIAAVLLTLPKWIGPAATGFHVALRRMLMWVFVKRPAVGILF